LNSYESIFTSKFQVIIKIHPKAPLNKFDLLLKNNNIKNLDIIVLRDCDSLTVNYYSDYVIGMHSNMVIESFLLGKKLLRVQTGQLSQDLIKLSPLRNNVIIYKNQLKDSLYKFLKK
jgi:predicted glycosyltransferase